MDDKEYDYYSSLEFQQMSRDADPRLPFFVDRCMVCETWLNQRTENNLCIGCTDKYDQSSF
jgi:hypothetical protein